MKVLICYDGSADAQAATERRGLLMSGNDATVLVIWETILEAMTRHGSLGRDYVARVVTRFESTPTVVTT